MESVGPRGDRGRWDPGPRGEAREPRARVQQAGVGALSSSRRSRLVSQVSHGSQGGPSPEGPSAPRGRGVGPGRRDAAGGRGSDRREPGRRAGCARVDRRGGEESERTGGTPPVTYRAGAGNGVGPAPRRLVPPWTSGRPERGLWSAVPRGSPAHRPGLRSAFPLRRPSRRALAPTPHVPASRARRSQRSPPPSARSAPRTPVPRRRGPPPDDRRLQIVTPSQSSQAPPSPKL